MQVQTEIFAAASRKINLGGVCGQAVFFSACKKLIWFGG